MLLGDGDGPVTTAIKYYYLNGQRVAQAKDGVFTWIHADHLSSATRITDAAGLEVRRLAYAAFGEEAENQGSGDDPKYTYTGKEHDATGLYYYGARYYDPALSRFITADTVYNAGPQGLNRYSYALNNPLRYIDPSGYASKEWENWEDELKQNVENRFADVDPYDLTDEKKEAITFEEVRKLQNKYRLLYYQTREYDPGLAILDPLYQQEIAEHGIKNKKVRAFIQGFLIGFGIGLQTTAQDALTQEALPEASNRGVTRVLENSSKSEAAQLFEDGAPGVTYDIATKKRIVPALRFDNPNPRGQNIVRFDGIEGKRLIDRKINITTKSKQLKDLQRMSEALRQNPDYTGVIQVPNEKIKRAVQRALNKANVDNIIVEVVK